MRDGLVRHGTTQVLFSCTQLQTPDHFWIRDGGSHISTWLCNLPWRVLLFSDPTESKRNQIDEHGADLVTAALPGMGWKALRDSLESTMQHMVRLAGVHAQRQATNFMLGKVRDP